MNKKYEEALAWLYAQKKSQKREDLSRIKRCIQLLNIRTDYHIIHIAGTNGKGSTASFIQQMLILKGKKVGLFVSPYVIAFNERIQVNHEYIQEEEVIHDIQLLKDFSYQYQDAYQDTIPFFELTFLMALLYYEKQGIDYLVLECGLGGLLDATNGVEKDVAVITNIGYDHMAQLGDTLESIARHKLGITRKDVPCFTTVDEALIPYFEEYGKRNGVPLYFIKPSVSNIEMNEKETCFTYNDIEYKTNLRGVYQAYNASLAISVIQYLFPNYPKSLVEKALASTVWPGRFELVRENILLDGAHNIDGIRALCESLKKGYADKKIKVIFTALKDKAIKEMLTLLDEVSSMYYFTTILDKRATESREFIAYTNKPSFVFYCIKLEACLSLQAAPAERWSYPQADTAGSSHHSGIGF